MVYSWGSINCIPLATIHLHFHGQESSALLSAFYHLQTKKIAQRQWTLEITWKGLTQDTHSESFLFCSFWSPSQFFLARIIPFQQWIFQNCDFFDVFLLLSITHSFKNPHTPTNNVPQMMLETVHSCLSLNTSRYVFVLREECILLFCWSLVLHKLMQCHRTDWQTLTNGLAPVFVQLVS